MSQMSERARSSAALSSSGPLEDNFLVGIGIIALFAVIHLAAGFGFATYPDEAYYFMWSRDLSVGYWDHPPMVAWWIRAGTELLGDSDIAGRVPFIAGIVANSVAIYWIGRLLFDQKIGIRAAVWFNATILVAVVGMIAVPDGPAILFWTLATLAFVLVIKTQQGAWWLAVGLFAGLGLASKYTVFFLGISLILCLIVYPDYRRWLASPWLWAGGAVAILVFAPVFLWNFQHDWGSLGHQFKRIAVEAPQFPKYLYMHVGGFIGLLNPILAVFAGLGIWRWATRQAGPHGRGLGVLILMALPIVVFMTARSFQAIVDEHWLSPAYPEIALIAACGASMLPRWGTRHWSSARSLVVPVAIVISILGALVIGGQFGWLAPNAALQFKGWPQFAEAADQLRREVGAEWIGVNDYNYVAELSHQLRERVLVEQVDERFRYVYRPPPDSSVTARRGLVLISGRGRDRYLDCIGEMTAVGKVDHLAGGRVLRSFQAFTVEGVAPDVFTVGCD